MISSKMHSVTRSGLIYFERNRIDGPEAALYTNTIVKTIEESNDTDVHPRITFMQAKIGPDAPQCVQS